MPDGAAGGALVLLAILLVAANLRVAVTSLGALLGEVNGDLGLSPTALGVLTTLPTVAFAAVGVFTPGLTRRFGPTPLLLTTMSLLAAGELMRALTSSAVVFFGASALALAGIAVANILLPVLVKRYFPNRLGIVTGIYTTSMILGSAIAAAVSVPIAHAAGSWRVGLGVWALVAVAAILPVLALRRSGPVVAAANRAKRIRPGRTRLGWALALFFGTQSFSGYALMGWLPQIYRDAGFSPQTAGLLLAGMIGLGVPIALVMPTYAARRPDQRLLVGVLAGAMLVAYVGLAVAPRAGVLVWTGLLAIGQGAFPLTLTLVGLRARTPAGTVALSAFAQSMGYLIAICGPVVVGVLYDATGGWVASLCVLLAVLAVQAIAGFSAARPRLLEDELPRGSAVPTDGRDVLVAAG